MLLSEAREDYIAYAKVELGQSPLTVQKRGWVMRLFGEYLAAAYSMADPEVREIKLPHCRTYLTDLYDKGLKAKTIRGYFEAIRVLFGYLEEYSYIEESPAKRVKLPKANSPSHALLSNDELIRMFEACTLLRPARRAALGAGVLAVFSYAGLRNRELRDLRVGDLSFDGEECLVSIREGKGGKARVVPLHAEALPYIRNWLALRGECKLDYLFMFNHGQRLGAEALSHLFAEIKWLARLDRPDLKPHTLRHAYATRKLASGVNLYHISALLGHSEISTTVNYLHADLSQLKGAAQAGGLHR